MPTRSRLARAWCALGAALALASGCIDERISLGHHQAPPLLPSGGMMAAGGSGGTSGMGGSGGAPFEPPDAAIVEPTPDAAIEPTPDASTPRTNPCMGSVYAATLRCAVDFGEPMSTESVLMMTPPPFDQSGERAAVRGELAFTAWNADFNAFLAGELDCVRGELHVEIVQGTVQPMQGPAMGFGGMLDAFVDPSSDFIQGMWLHAASMGGPACIGQWSAVRQD